MQAASNQQASLGSMAPALTEEPPVDVGPPDEGALRQLFDLCDRDRDGLIKKRELLISLKRNAAVRPLFGLPATSTEAGGTLNSRLQHVLNAFEANGGLGELQPEFDEVAAASPSANAVPVDDPEGIQGDSNESGLISADVNDGSSPQVAKVDHITWDSFLQHFSSDESKHRAHLGISLLPSPEAATPKMVFVPTTEWKEVPNGFACPAGLEFKMDVDTGKNYARLYDSSKAA